MTEKESPTSTGVEEHDDLGVTIRWSAYSHRLEFMAKNHTRQPDGSVIYYKTEGGVCGVPADSFEEGERLVEGFIKWDGCSHLTFGAEEDEGYVHLCGERDFRTLHWVLQQAFTLASQHVTSFNRGVAA